MPLKTSVSSPPQPAPDNSFPALFHLNSDKDTVALVVFDSQGRYHRIIISQPSGLNSCYTPMSFPTTGDLATFWRRCPVGTTVTITQAAP
jgi:hypothetical protein